MTAASTPTTASMLRSQITVEQRLFWRNRSGMFFTFMLPIAILFVLALGDEPLDSVSFIIGLSIISTGFQMLGIQLAMHRDQGVLKRIMATPLPATVLIAGKAISTAIVALVEVAIILTVGIALFDAPVPDQPLILLLFVLAGTATFVALGYALASVIPSSESAPALTNAAYLGLLLVTALLEFVDAIPDPIQDVGQFLPLNALISPIDAAWISGWHASDWWSLVALAGWCTLAAVWSVRRFRWEPANER